MRAALILVPLLCCAFLKLCPYKLVKCRTQSELCTLQILYYAEVQMR